MDGLLWLRLLGLSLAHPAVQAAGQRAGLTARVVNCRVRCSDASCPRCGKLDPGDRCRGCGSELTAADWQIRGVDQDGMLRLDLMHEHTVTGGITYSTTLVPVGAANAHDTEHVLRLLRRHEAEGRVMLTETSLAIVDGTVH